MFEMGMPDDDQHTLKIVRVKSTDVGQITCVASNQYGSDSCNFNLELAGESLMPILESCLMEQAIILFCLVLIFISVPHK